MKTAILIMIGLAMCICMSAFAENVSVVRDATLHEFVQPDQNASGERDTYTGTLRMYLVEPDYRYADDDGYHYEFGFLKWAQPTTVLNLADGESYYSSVETMNSGLSEDNIAVSAAVFSPDAFAGNHCPNYCGYTFTGHAVDNAAFAEPGKPGVPPQMEGFTHPIFIEEGTATW